MQERKPGCICELNSETGDPEVENYEMCPVHKSDAPNPKQFAEDYIKMFEPNINWEDYDEKGKRIDHAKRCAIKLVDEILNILEPFKRNGYVDAIIVFYRKVKEELNAL
jgi:hypothetical protein